MKHKKFVIFLLSTIAIFIIFKLTTKNEINYLALGDSITKGETPFGTYGTSFSDNIYKYFKKKYKEKITYINYAHEDYRITDLIKDIDDAENINSDKEKITITQTIKEADIITLSVGSEELFYKLRQNKDLSINKEKITRYVDEMYNDMNILISKIRKLTKKPIIVVGYYNPLKTNNEDVEKIFNYIDSKFKKIEQDNTYYIDLYMEFKYNNNYLPNPDISFPSLEGYNIISEKIINLIQTKKLL